jgi:Tol biopolymer transport system component
VRGGEEQSSTSLVWVDRRGNETPIPGRPSEYQELDLSPDGSRVVVNVGVNALAGGTGTGDVWIHQLARGTLSRFTFGPSSNETPVWSPDGSEVAYAGQQEGDRRFVFVKPADGRPERKVGEKSGHFHVTSWSPRDPILAIAETGTGMGGGDIWLLHMADQKFEPLVQTPFSERSPAFSPDGRWLAYVTNESGRDEVYVQAFPGPGGRSQVSTDGGVTPVWARNGREIFYRNGDKMMAVPIESSGQTLQPGTPVPLFEKRYLYSTGDQYYDVSSDGQRFVMLKQDAGNVARSIVVVQEWTRELERLVPATR